MVVVVVVVVVCVCVVVVVDFSGEITSVHTTERIYENHTSTSAPSCCSTWSMT